MRYCFEASRSKSIEIDMKRYFLFSVLLSAIVVAGHRTAAQSPERPLPILQIWEAGPLPDNCTADRYIDTVFTFDGKRYEQLVTIVHKNILSFKDIQREQAPQTSDVPAVFMRLGSFRADTSYHSAQAVRKHELKGLQIFPSEEFESLRKYDPFNVLVILDSPDDSMRVYKPGEDMVPRSEETVSLAELQAAKAPQTRNRPCIFQYDDTLIGEDFDRYRVPRERAIAVRVIPSESFKELKNTGIEFYILNVTAF